LVVKVNEIMSIPKSSPESSSVSASVGLHGKPQPPLWLAPMLAGMHREKIRVRQELGRLKGALAFADETAQWRQAGRLKNALRTSRHFAVSLSR
jgi:hypothetical protein